MNFTGYEITFLVGPNEMRPDKYYTVEMTQWLRGTNCQSGRYSQVMEFLSIIVRLSFHQL